MVDEERFTTKRSTEAYMTQSSRKSYDPYQELAMAIILQQVIDLKKSLKASVNLGHNIKDNPQLIKADYFFHSGWFDELCLGTLDGHRVLKEIISEFEEKNNKI